MKKEEGLRDRFESFNKLFPLTQFEINYYNIYMIFFGTVHYIYFFARLHARQIFLFLKMSSLFVWFSFSTFKFEA
jgi:hypothetical protein